MVEPGTPNTRFVIAAWRGLLLAAMLLVVMSGPAVAQVIEIKLADDPDTGLRDVLLQALVEDAGDQPLELRILRMTLQPGASSPWHAHPGLEFGVIEAGTLRVQVNGPAVLRPADAAADTESQTVPENLDVSLTAGDRIAYAPGTEMTFVNASAEPAVVLAATVFPAGPGAPAPAAFRAGPPTEAQNQGIESVILGQAIVDDAPTGSVIVFERLDVDAGNNVAAFPGPVLMAMEEGTVAGSVRAPEAAAPGDSTSASSDEIEFSLSRGEAAFFSSGMSEAPLGGDGHIVLLRLGIVPAPQADPAATTPGATAAAEQGSERPIPISTARPTSPPTPEATEAPARQIRTITVRPTATADEAEDPAAPETTAQAGTAAPADPNAVAPAPVGDEAISADESGAGAYPAPGTVLMVNDDEVRIRAEPSTNGAILAGLSRGQLVVVLGEPVAADGFIWYPVQDVVAPELQGWVAAPFLSVAAQP